MNKDAIQNTAITHWSNDDNCFIVESPLMDSVIGAGDTVEKAQEDFKAILSDAYEAYLEGRIPNEKPGRPAKNGIALNTDVKAETRATIKKLASEMQCSQGEMVDYLVAFHKHFKAAVHELQSSTRTKPATLWEAYSRFRKELELHNWEFEPDVFDDLRDRSPGRQV